MPSVRPLQWYTLRFRELHCNAKFENVIAIFIVGVALQALTKTCLLYSICNCIHILSKKMYRLINLFLLVCIGMD